MARRILGSARVRSRAARLTKTEAPAQKRATLPVHALGRQERDIVATAFGLDAAAFSEEEAVAAGFLMFAVHSRSRCAD